MSKIFKNLITLTQIQNGAPGTGVEIKGLAYIIVEGDPTPGNKYTLYTNQELTQEITGATNGDSYLANGYLFVYNETDKEEDKDKFSCIGRI